MITIALTLKEAKALIDIGFKKELLEYQLEKRAKTLANIKYAINWSQKLLKNIDLNDEKYLDSLCEIRDILESQDVKTWFFKKHSNTFYFVSKLLVFLSGKKVYVGDEVEQHKLTISNVLNLLDEEMIDAK